MKKSMKKNQIQALYMVAFGFYGTLFLLGFLIGFKIMIVLLMLLFILGIYQLFKYQFAISPGGNAPLEFTITASFLFIALLMFWYFGHI